MKLVCFFTLYLLRLCGTRKIIYCHLLKHQSLELSTSFISIGSDQILEHHQIFNADGSLQPNAHCSMDATTGLPLVQSGCSIQLVNGETTKVQSNQYFVHPKTGENMSRL